MLIGTNQHLVPPPKLLYDSIPFAEDLELIVEIDIDPRGTTDYYINNLISLTVDVEGTDNLVPCNRAPLLAFDTCSRPLHKNEPIPQEMMEARNKLKSEAGWLLNFRQLLIHLPENKFVAWSEAIRKMIKDGALTAKEIESNIDCLTHLGA